MKKNLSKVVIVFVSILAVINGATAQSLANVRSGYRVNEMYIKKVSFLTNHIGDKELVSQKALNHFARTYKNVTGERWMTTANGFAVRFTSNDIQTSVFYDCKGRWAGSVKYYKEEKMPSDLRHIVKSTYYDYNIMSVQEVETTDSPRDIPTYIICIEDQDNIKQLKVNRGEIEVWKEFQRADK
jgi:hypothetical protein